MYRKEYIAPILFLTQVFSCFQQLKENMMTNLIMGGVANNEDKSGKENSWMKFWLDHAAFDKLTKKRRRAIIINVSFHLQ